MEARKQLRTWRRAQDLTQTELASKLGCTKDFIGLLERGERMPGLRFANAVKRLTGILQDDWDEPAATTKTK